MQAAIVRDATASCISRLLKTLLPLPAFPVFSNPPAWHQAPPSFPWNACPFIRYRCCSTGNSPKNPLWIRRQKVWDGCRVRVPSADSQTRLPPSPSFSSQAFPGDISSSISAPVYLPNSGRFTRMPISVFKLRERGLKLNEPIPLPADHRRLRVQTHPVRLDEGIDVFLNRSAVFHLQNFHSRIEHRPP